MLGGKIKFFDNVPRCGIAVFLNRFQTEGVEFEGMADAQHLRIRLLLRPQLDERTRASWLGKRLQGLGLSVMAEVVNYFVFDRLIDRLDVNSEFDVSADSHNHHLIGMRYAEIDRLVLVSDERLAKVGFVQTAIRLAPGAGSPSAKAIIATRCAPPSRCRAVQGSDTLAAKYDRHQLID